MMIFLYNIYKITLWFHWLAPVKPNNAIRHWSPISALVSEVLRSVLEQIRQDNHLCSKWLAISTSAPALSSETAHSYLWDQTIS